jgi:hypothetical protein
MDCSVELKTIKNDFFSWLENNLLNFIFTIIAASLVGILAYYYVPYHIGTIYGPFSIIALVIQGYKSNYIFHPLMFLIWIIAVICEITRIFII